jgi:import inner membrane translocase subunit TIM23
MRQAQPEFIFPEGASKHRGRFELSFSQIGSSVMVGAAIGGVAGFYNGVRATAIAEQTGKLRRTQILNHVMKQGAGTANTLGTVAVLYAAFGCLLSWGRGEDDEINTIVAGTATGLMYKSTAGLRRCAVGGGIGLALSSAWVLYNMSSSKFNKNQYI